MISVSFPGLRPQKAGRGEPGPCPVTVLFTGGCLGPCPLHCPSLVEGGACTLLGAALPGLSPFSGAALPPDGGARPPSFSAPFARGCPLKAGGCSLDRCPVPTPGSGHCLIPIASPRLLGRARALARLSPDDIGLGYSLQQCPGAHVLEMSGCFSSSGLLRANNEEPAKFQPPPKPVIIDPHKQKARERFLSPEFIPPRQRTAPLKFYIERTDMIRRRKILDIPEFYVGSILSVTTADKYASDKTSCFVGICIQRGGKGLGATFVLRNVIEGQGVEIRYELYNPRIREIKVLKLEKRLDDNLMYLRDALPEYSTFDVNMQPVAHSANDEIPVNKLKVKMKPKPWTKRWERPQFNIQGIHFELPEKIMEEAQKWSKPWIKFDMLREYDTSKLEKEIWEEVNEALKK